MTGQHTFCRICEPLCGLVATVEEGRLVSVRSDPDHVHSEGFFCTKASAMVEITYDPDRVLQPLKRVGGPGEFEPVSWDEAMTDIARRLRAIRRTRGASAVATFVGNPPAFSYSAMMWLSGFQEALGVSWRYGINSEDAAARMVANRLLYGSVLTTIVPDLWRTDLAVVIGANPFVSRGSLVSEPRFREALDSIVARGGRVVVIDPRRTQTANRYEHVPVRAGADAFLLLGLIHVLVTEGLVDRAFLAEHTTGYDAFERAVASFDVERCSAACGVPAAEITALARAIAASPSAVVYGRTGTCTQRFGTLNNLLQDIVMVLTGNLERVGGGLFGWGLIDFARFADAIGLGTYGKVHSRTTGHPDVVGLLPSTSLVSDITTPGEGQIRALVGMGCNPMVTSAAGGPKLAAALEELELHVALDLYVNETNKHAHYVLPTTAMFEREDVPFIGLGLMLRPAIWATEPVIEPRGEARPEWKILDELARRVGVGGAYNFALMRWLARLGLRVTPRRMADLMLRTSSHGDWFGLRRGGISFRRLTQHEPSGRLLREDLPVKPLRSRLKTRDRKIGLALPELIGELDRLDHHQADDVAFPLRMLGLREVRSHNSWMHNSERLMPDARHQSALVHPLDAATAGVEDGDLALIASRTASITVAVSVTDEMMPGNVAVPHGWGHAGGWQRANRAGGGCSNNLASDRAEDIEPLAGMSELNGVPIRLSRMAVDAAAASSGGAGATGR